MSNFVELVDLASEILGGAALAASDDSIGSRQQLLMPGAPRHGGEGWAPELAGCPARPRSGVWPGAQEISTFA